MFKDRFDAMYYYKLSPSQILVKNVVSKIREERNYDEAAQIFINNNLTFEQLSFGTLRLNIFDISKLADIVLKLK